MKMDQADLPHASLGDKRHEGFSIACGFQVHSARKHMSKHEVPMSFLAIVIRWRRCRRKRILAAAPPSEFSMATNVQELCQLLDVKGGLWGSQKYYVAAELKILINRVRSRNPTLQLPVALIPHTGGL